MVEPQIARLLVLQGKLDQLPQAAPVTPGTNPAAPAPSPTGTPAGTPPALSPPSPSTPGTPSNLASPSTPPAVPAVPATDFTALQAAFDGYHAAVLATAKQTASDLAALSRRVDQHTSQIAALRT